jgi:hypothetical protein
MRYEIGHVYDGFEEAKVLHGLAFLTTIFGCLFA